MREPKRARRLLALAAAYVVALQALLLPLSVAAASPFAGGLCAAAHSLESPPAPVPMPAGCGCAAGCGMECGTQHALAPPSIVLVPFDTYIADNRPTSALAPVVRPSVRGPQIPRAPPLA